MDKNNVNKFRKIIEKRYRVAPTGCGGSFDELLCYELHTQQPVNPRMDCKTFSDGFCTGLTFKELAEKWGISVKFLGELIADHCERKDKMPGKNHKKYLMLLTKSVAQSLSRLDCIMKEESTFERGKKIAKLSNTLDMKNDEAMRFGLDYGWRKINNIKKQLS